MELKTRMHAADEIASVQFTAWKDLYHIEKPFMMFMDIPADSKDRRVTNVDFSCSDIRIEDIRGREKSFQLDENGFKVVSMQDTRACSDPSEIETRYLPEVQRLLRREIDGVDRVFIFDWRWRNAELLDDDKKISNKDLGDRNEFMKPSNTAHVGILAFELLSPYSILTSEDQAPIAALKRVRSQLGQDADKMMKGRIRIINVWRPVSHEVFDWPLALCDGSTIQKSDFLDTDQVRATYIGSSMFMMKNETMKWYFLRRQRPDEVLLFKQFDSKDDVKARFCPHAAFLQNDVPIGSPPRMSVEVRALVFTDVRSDDEVKE